MSGVPIFPAGVVKIYESPTKFSETFDLKNFKTEKHYGSNKWRSEKLNNVEFTSHPADKSGKSVANGIYLDLPSGDTAMVECYIWSKEYKEKHGGHKDNLRVTLSNKDGNDFVNNEAYK